MGPPGAATSRGATAPPAPGAPEYFVGRHGSAGASRAAHGGLGGRPEPPIKKYRTGGAR
jgi:hypothetical protein